MNSRHIRRISFFLTKLIGNLVGLGKIFAICKTRKKVPPITNNLLFISGTKLAEGIRKGKISSENVVKAYIARCEEVNPYINAIVDERFDLAIEEAISADKLVRSRTKTEPELEELFPLLGIPITVKESISVKGLNHTAGTAVRAPHKATHDAESVKQLKAAGAIILLVSNTPEMCLNLETFNNLTGRTCNPYDLRRTPGGSSGGEGALLASGASVIGIGSDIAGSVRVPSLFCGLFGYKPSPFLTPIDSHIPSCNKELWGKVFTLGPMVRYAEDIPLVMKVLQLHGSTPLQSEKNVSIPKMKFYFKLCDTSGSSTTVSPCVHNAMLKVIQHFKSEHMVDVKEVDLQKFDDGVNFIIFCIGGIKGVESVLSREDNPSEWHSVWPELLKKLVCFSEHQTMSLFYCCLARILHSIPENVHEKHSQMLNRCEMELAKLLGSNGVLLYPTLPYTAPFHNDYIQRILDLQYTAIFNVLGYPSIHCPVGLNEDGLPVGIQVIANRGCDHLLFAIAKEIEAAFGGWVPAE